MTTVIPTPLGELIVEGVARLLVAEMPDVFRYRDDTPLDGLAIPLTPMKLPTSPARAVSVGWYPLAASPTLSQSEGGVQFVSRSSGEDIREAWQTDELIRRSLMGRSSLRLDNGAWISELHWSSGGSLGQDEQSRWRVSSNFTALVYDPTPHRF